jgi:hypothetical protein
VSYGPGNMVLLLLTTVSCFTVLFIVNITTIHNTLEMGEGSEQAYIQPFSVLLCNDRMMR